MLTGAAILPTAPLIVPGASPTLPEGVARVADAIDATVERLPDHDVLVLLAGGAAPAVHTSGAATLAGVGRPDITAEATVDAEIAERIVRTCGWPPATDAPLPLDLSVLVLLLGEVPAVVPVVVSAGATFDDLATAGGCLAGALEDRQGVVVAAGDCAAGLTERSPLHLVDGAADFDAAVVDAIDGGRLDALAKLGPEEARRVGARGWAPMATLHGVLEAAKLGLVRRHYSAPQGVGYLVAQGA